MSFFEKIFSISSETDFNEVALELFAFQMAENPLYAKFVNGLQGAGCGLRGAGYPKHYTQISCIPIEFFKTHKILIDGVNTGQYFASSGTTGVNTSKHFIADFKLYEKSFTKGFSHFFGSPEKYIILALLPNYLEQQHSSLIYMMNDLIRQTKSPYSGFYLNNLDELNETIKQCGSFRLRSTTGFQINRSTNQQINKSTILFGVSYALLDFAEQFPQTLENTLIFETGGMKGRREELSKTELHARLCKAFSVEKIYSEYGMTELLSQAYSKGDNIFACPPWMRVFTRPLNDPLGIENHHIAGGINVIDLANFNSCPFIATQDLGKTFPDRSFEILGRLADSDIRGCSLLIDNVK